MGRLCTTCKESYPATTEYFYKANTKVGLRSKCKKCMNAEAVNHSQVQDTKYKEIYDSFNRTELTKKCGACGIVLPATLEHFFKQSTGKHGLRSFCKKCYVAKNRARKQTDEYKAKAKEYRARHYEENKEMYAKRWQERYHANREYHLRRVAEYIKNNPEKAKEGWRRKDRRRREKTKGLIETYTTEQWQDCKKHFGETCAYCGERANKLTQDHFQPLSKNGEYTHYNIVPACVSCNSSKGDKSFYSWYPKQDFYCKQRERKILKYLNIKDRSQQITLAL